MAHTRDLEEQVNTLQKSMVGIANLVRELKTSVEAMEKKIDRIIIQLNESEISNSVMEDNLEYSNIGETLKSVNVQKMKKKYLRNNEPTNEKRFVAFITQICDAVDKRCQIY